MAYGASKSLLRSNASDWYPIDLNFNSSDDWVRWNEFEFLKILELYFILVHISV